jgi:hypothetical protein
MIKKAVEKLKKDNEKGARQNLLEELFYDFHKSRIQVYWMNFFRGVFFGFGTALGGTLVVAIIVWALSQFAGWFPFVGENINQITDSMQRSK